MEALAKLKEGVAFNQVATEYSEDKARQGVCSSKQYKDYTFHQQIDCRNRMNKL